MLTGDHEHVARAIASAAGVHHVQLLPHDKSAAVAELAQHGRPVAMVGDGINDAPALAVAVADVGIAMGASGSTVALETADVALMADELDKLPPPSASPGAPRASCTRTSLCRSSRSL